MSTQVTVTLPDNVYQRAQRMAEMSGQDVEAILADRLSLSLPPLRSELDSRPVATLSDQEVMVLAEGMMEETLSARMSVLLQKQQAEPMTDDERAELRMLMDIYEVGQLRKAQALAEAVKRGLRGPLEP